MRENARQANLVVERMAMCKRAEEKHMFDGENSLDEFSNGEFLSFILFRFK